MYLWYSSLLSSTQMELRRENAFLPFLLLHSFYSHLLFPHSRAKKIQWLLLTLPYHLSAFHHHRYPHHHHHLSFPSHQCVSPLLSSSLCVAVSSVFFLSCKSRLTSAVPSCVPTPIHHPIDAAWFLLHLSLWSFDLHKITELPESIWPQNMKALLFKSGCGKALMCVVLLYYRVRGFPLYSIAINCGMGKVGFSILDIRIIWKKQFWLTPPENWLES